MHGAVDPEAVEAPIAPGAERSVNLDGVMEFPCDGYRATGARARSGFVLAVRMTRLGSVVGLRP